MDDAVDRPAEPGDERPGGDDRPAQTPPPGPVSAGGAGRAARRRAAEDADRHGDAQSADPAAPTGPAAGNDTDTPRAAADEAAGTAREPDRPESGAQTPASQAGEKVKKNKKKGRGFLKETGLILVIALVVAVVVQAFFVRIYLIPSQSMEPTLHGCPGCTGDRIAVDKISYRFTDPAPGDVVVFRGPPAWDAGFVSNRSDNVIVRGFQEVGSFVGLVAPDENDMVKRIIATGGQTVQCLEGDPGVMVDGEVLDEPYLAEPAATSPWVDNACQGEYFGPITVPEDHYWMMGDNRTDSADSRYHIGDELQGTVPRDNIIGKARWKVLPFSRIGGVSDHDPQG